MAMPSAVVTTNLDASTDQPALARVDLLAGMEAINSLITNRGAVDGLASLDSGGKVPNTELPATLITAGSANLTLSPDSNKVNINNFMNLTPLTVTAVNAITTPVEGDVAYCSNGNAGVNCFAVYDGAAWKVVAFGATISAT